MHQSGSNSSHIWCLKIAHWEPLTVMWYFINSCRGILFSLCPAVRRSGSPWREERERKGDIDNSLLAAAKGLACCSRTLQQARCLLTTWVLQPSDGFAWLPCSLHRDSSDKRFPMESIQCNNLEQAAHRTNQYSWPHYCLSGCLTELQLFKSLSC